MGEIVNRADADEALTAAVNAFNTWDGADEGYIATNAVLIIGFQKITDDGYDLDSVGAYPLNGSAPTYVTLGLIEAAKAHLQQGTTGDDD